METTTHEIADNIFRFSTYIEGPNMPFNQYLVVADEPLLWHTGHRQLFPLVSEAVSKVMPIDRLRWISFGHFEADECGSMNQWLAAAPNATVVHGATAVFVSLMDQADREPRIAANGEVLDLGGKRMRWLDTPHVPHAWEAGLMFEETTSTFFCGDLFTRQGDVPPTSADDIVGPAIAAEDIFHATSLTPATGPTIRRLTELNASTLALMHGPAYTGDTKHALMALGEYYDGLVDAQLSAR
jgi:flavorubredoxin